MKGLPLCPTGSVRIGAEKWSLWPIENKGFVVEISLSAVCELPEKGTSAAGPQVDTGQWAGGWEGKLDVR